MAYEEALKKKEDCLVGEIGIEEVGLAAGRSQRERKRSYKDFLREEEEIDAEVRKSAKKKTKETEDFLSGADSHKKKKKLHLTGDDMVYGELTPTESVRRKKRSDSHHSDTAMGLLKAITSPALSKSSKKTEKSLFSPFSSSSHHSFPTESKKEHKKRSGGADSEDAGQEGEGHKAKKLKFVNSEGVGARDGEGLRVKLLLSPKDKSSTDDEVFGLKKPAKKGSREEQAAFPKAQGVKRKHRADARVSESFESEGSFYSDVHGSGLAEFPFSGLETLDTGSSSGAELEAGELIIDDSYREIKKRKKAKKSKKKKDKDREKHKEKKHSKSKRVSGLSPGEVKASVVAYPPPQPAAVTSAPYSIPAPPPPIFHTNSHSEKKKRKEEKEREKFDPKLEKKKKIMTAYQVFCKEYRVNIIAEHPAIGKKDFGELSKKLAEVWKQLPEKEKLAWKQKCLYLQHKQNKAEATTIKRKPTDSTEQSATKSTKSSKTKGLQRRHISSQFRRRTISGSFLTDAEGGQHHSSPLSGISSSHRKPSHCSASSSATHSVSPVKVPEAEPIDAAAHLQLLGESLSLIGHRLQETEGMVAVSGSLSVLLDSIICALGPLACLTAHVRHLNGCSKDILANTLDNIAYIMPGL